MRHRFISDIYREFVGPRGGATEQITFDPGNEYLVGQLIPQDIEEDEVIEEEGLGDSTGFSGEEDNDSDVPSLLNQTMIEAGKSFRRVPSSFGISFALARQPAAGDIQVCVTWGRYIRLESGQWSRTPNVWFEQFGERQEAIKENSDGTLKLYCNIISANDGKWKCSIYLVSCVDIGDRTRKQTEDIVFQPEIRVTLADESNLRQFGDSDFVSMDEEWKIATKQYEDLTVFARGHLCGAYWRAIDPQREYNGPIVGAITSPFIWVDGAHFATDKRINEFRVPTLRTDFIPMYSSPAPIDDQTLTNVEGLNAETLWHVTTRPQLRSILQPIADAYMNWIDSQARLPGYDIVTIVQRHRAALRRISQGIEFVTSDENAFVSFLFMNRVMDMQFRWTRNAPMRWKPFQLAFILLSIRSSVIAEDPERQTCDTIWFPTGGGKTEAYLGLACFVLAHRRRSSDSDESGDKCGEGVGIISRYTLRLLTIQQFRRALKMIAAAEVVRCEGEGERRGWRPIGFESNENWFWGRSPFSLGLWVGSKVTPNQMTGEGWGATPPGALSLLKGYPKESESDPAQVINCPCCGSILSFPVEGLPRGETDYRFVATGRISIAGDLAARLSTPQIIVRSIANRPHRAGKISFFELKLDLPTGVKPSAFNKWWSERVEPILGVRMISFNPSRPGYFPLEEGRKKSVTDYEIRCTNHNCSLSTGLYRAKRPIRGGTWDWLRVHPLFCLDSRPSESIGIPIQAITVDKKLYASLPSMLVSTCDKIASSSYLPDAASFFGRVRTYDPAKGFSQRDLSQSRNLIECENFLPPSLVIQDELHLLEGPLGSSFGLFETVVDALAERPKYIASSATIRNSHEQVISMLGRNNFIFPPPNISISNGFFLKSEEIHPLDERRPGRLFLGLAFPGRPPQTPTVRSWGRLLQTAQDLLDEGADLTDLDHFWTLVGYFNAVRELAQAESYWRQDIPGFLDYVHAREGRVRKRRSVPQEQFENLSSQTDSSKLPGILTRMEMNLRSDECLDGVLTTSMFGTGVDVSRLSLMLMHGQPKAASQYIQALGRIGRSRAGLGVILFRVSKARDLNHYEYFTGYHRRLAIAVEPITVKPLSSKALDKFLGAMLVSMARNWKHDSIIIPHTIEAEEGAILAEQVPQSFWESFVQVMVRRWDHQPEMRRYLARDEFIEYVRSKIDMWVSASRRRRELGLPLRYTTGEVTLLGGSESVEEVFPNGPRSLREVESVIKILRGDD